MAGGHDTLNRMEKDSSSLEGFHAGQARQTRHAAGVGEYPRSPSSAPALTPSAIYTQGEIEDPKGRYDMVKDISDAIITKRLEEEGVPSLILEAIDNLNKTVQAQQDFILFLAKSITQQSEHIGELYQLIHKIAPELEIIETMADTAEEEKEYLDKYMNHGDYLSD